MMDDEEEKPAIVIDNGSGMMKAGCYGKNGPASTPSGMNIAPSSVSLLWPGGGSAGCASSPRCTPFHVRRYPGVAL